MPDTRTTFLIIQGSAYMPPPPGKLLWAQHREGWNQDPSEGLNLETEVEEEDALRTRGWHSDKSRHLERKVGGQEPTSVAWLLSVKKRQEPSSQNGTVKIVLQPWDWREITELKESCLGVLHRLLDLGEEEIDTGITPMESYGNSWGSGWGGVGGVRIWALVPNL